ncbi:Mediator of RNA polymerase II transcription subunit 23, partial [Apophysomyces sp. BC1034]
YPPNKPDLPLCMLDVMIQKHQWVDFNHVLAALLKGGGSAERSRRAFYYVRYLLFDSPYFYVRVEKWESLNFNSRHWAEEDFHEKLMQFLDEFPEYREFEAFAMNSNEQAKPVLDPPLQTPMPIYLTNVVSDFVSTFELLITRLIEHNETDLLARVLDRYDYDQYDIAPEAMEYSRNDEMDGSVFDASYFERVIYKLAGSLNPKKCAPHTKPNLPERHFREIGSPAVEGISIATLEIMLTPVPPATI